MASRVITYRKTATCRTGKLEVHSITFQRHRPNRFFVPREKIISKPFSNLTLEFYYTKNALTSNLKDFTCSRFNLLRSSVFFRGRDLFNLSQIQHRFACTVKNADACRMKASTCPHIGVPIQVSFLRGKMPVKHSHWTCRFPSRHPCVAPLCEKSPPCR